MENKQLSILFAKMAKINPPLCKKLAQMILIKWQLYPLEGVLAGDSMDVVLLRKGKVVFHCLLAEMGGGA